MTQALPVAEPSQRVSRGWVARFGLLWFGYWLAWLTPVQLLLPDQLDAIDHLHKVRDFGVINGGSGVVALLTLPLCGALCDRTRTRWGRRRVWVTGGLVVTAAGLVAAGAQTSWVALGVCWWVATLGTSMISAGLTALVADQVPDEQRGLTSGAMWGPQAVGVVVGLVAVTAIGGHGVLAWSVLAGALVATALPFLARLRESTAVGAPIGSGLWAGLWIDPRQHPDFGWAFAGRLAVNLGNALGTGYLLYFLQDYLRVAYPDTALIELTLVYLAFTLVATFVGGVWSDRTGRRRIFVGIAAALQAAAAVLLAADPTYGTALVAAAFLGAGYGAFMAVDQALVTAVLPTAEDRAKDLGIMTVGATVPQAVGPLLASVIISVLGGYRVLFAVSGLAGVVGALMVRNIRSVP